MEARSLAFWCAVPKALQQVHPQRELPPLQPRLQPPGGELRQVLRPGLHALLRRPLSVRAMPDREQRLCGRLPGPEGRQVRALPGPQLLRLLAGLGHLHSLRWPGAILGWDRPQGWQVCAGERVLFLRSMQVQCLLTVLLLSMPLTAVLCAAAACRGASTDVSLRARAPDCLCCA